MKKVYGFTSLIALALGGCATYTDEGVAVAPAAPAAEAPAVMPAPATAQNDDTIHQPGRRLDVVRHQNGGYARRCGALLKACRQSPRRRPVQSRKGLVEEQHVRGLKQQPAERHPAQFTP